MIGARDLVLNRIDPDLRRGGNGPINTELSDVREIRLTGQDEPLEVTWLDRET